MRETEIQPVFSPSRARASSRMNFPSLKNCNLPPEPPPLTASDCVPLPLSLPACFPGKPCAGFAFGPSAVGDEADEDEDAGEDCGETPTGSCCSWWWLLRWWWCAAADGDSRIVAVPLTVVVLLVAVVPPSSVIVAHFVRILLIISWLVAAELELELLELLPALELVG